jgi:hypothetical protein
MVKDNLFELFVYLFLFTQNHIALTLDGRFFQVGILENIGKDLDGFADIFLERFRIVDCILTLLKTDPLAAVVTEVYRETHRCVSIQMPAHVLNLKLQLILSPGLGSL